MLTKAKRRNLFLSIALVFSLGFLGSGIIGCTTAENVGGGTAIGAALGAGLGALAGDAGMGAAIGAGVGAMGGLAKDSMEKEQQHRVSQAQTNAEIQQLRVDAEIDRQISDLKERGYTPDQYQYRTGTTASGRIYVDPIKKEAYDRTEIIR